MITVITTFGKKTSAGRRGVSRGENPRVGFFRGKNESILKHILVRLVKVMTFTSWWNTISWIRWWWWCTCWFTLWDPESEVFDIIWRIFLQLHFWVSIEFVYLQKPSHIQPAPRSPGPTSDPFHAGWPISDSSEMSAMKAPNARHLEPTEHNGDIKWSMGMLESTSSSPQEKNRFFDEDVEGCCFGGCVAKIDFKKPRNHAVEIA